MRMTRSTEFMFDDNYMPLKKNGTFGWTKLTYVGDVKKRDEGHFQLRPDGARLSLGR